MKWIGALVFSLSSVIAEDCRVLVEGAGCRTRQLAMQRIWQELPGVTEVEIMPREKDTAPNHRWFVIRCVGDAPDKPRLIEELGRRAKHYHVLRVEKLENRENQSAR